ncbi:hypothetical protein Tco_0729887 [Tanacetum coccineum]|uniref:Uncharacterized protein n=1 Tax=Tanacetum coccineum TaxID=301880 RepID=A0ABQ4YRE6_9ASTR
MVDDLLVVVFGRLFVVDIVDDVLVIDEDEVVSNSKFKCLKLILVGFLMAFLKGELDEDIVGGDSGDDQGLNEEGVNENEDDQAYLRLSWCILMHEIKLRLGICPKAKDKRIANKDQRSISQSMKMNKEGTSTTTRFKNHDINEVKYFVQ